MSRPKDLTGQRNGLLTAIKPVGKTKFGHIKWLCKCDCGNETVVTTSYFRKNGVISCGCVKSDKKKIPITTDEEKYLNKKFGRLTVKSVWYDHHGRIRLTCKCECGAKVTRTDTTIHDKDRQACRKCGKYKKYDVPLHYRGGSSIRTYDELNRPFTKDTEWLICLYYSEKMPIEQIADILSRSVDTVENTIAECKANGKYEKYAHKSILYTEKSEAIKPRDNFRLDLRRLRR